MVRIGRRVALLAAVAIASQVLPHGLLPASADETPRPAVGVHVHGMWINLSDDERRRELQLLAEAGVEWVRLDVGWASLEPSKGTFDPYWTERLDVLVDEAERLGIQILAMLWRTPEWANGGAGVLAPPDDPRLYGDFAAWMAHRYAGRIAAYEVWNEPNDGDFYTGTVEQYVGLLRAANAAISVTDPQATVVLGGPSFNDTGWLSEVYAGGAQGHFDVMATHPYQGPSNLPPETPDTTGTNIWLLDHVRAVHDLMLRHGDGDKPIWFTEFGWFVGPSDPSLPNWEQGVTEQEQADYLLRTIDFVRTTHPYVENVFWYGARNNGTSSARLDNYGLLNYDLNPKPAYHALQSLLAASDVAASPTSSSLVCDDGGTTSLPFVDVPVSSVHAEAIACLHRDGLVNGMSKSHFGPATTVTRGQAATMLDHVLRNAGISLPHGTDRFRDDDADVHEAAIDRLAAAGILTGTGPGTVQPATGVRRDQLAAMLVRAYTFAQSIPLSDLASGDPFSDDDGSVHEDAIEAAAANGLARGTGTRTYSPLAPVRRDQMATFSLNLLVSVR